MTEVRFKVKFMDWDKGDKAELSKAVAEKYMGMGLCVPVKSPVKRKAKAAPSKKMVDVGDNK
jgi:hypothetical protein